MARFGSGSSILTSYLCALASLREILLWRLCVRSLLALPAMSQSSACSTNAFPLASFFFKAAKHLLILA
jgi:hypothetical protein